MNFMRRKLRGTQISIFNWSSLNIVLYCLETDKLTQPTLCQGARDEADGRARGQHRVPARAPGRARPESDHRLGLGTEPHVRVLSTR